MQRLTHLFFILMITLVSSANASFHPLLDSDLNDLSVYANGTITMADGVIAHGNMQALTTITLATNGYVGGNIEAGTTATLSDNVYVDGYIEATTTATLGANVSVIGKVHTGTTATFAADLYVEGNIEAGSTITLEADAEVKGDVVAKTTVTIAAGSHIYQDVDAGTIATIAANVAIDGTLTSNSSKDPPPAPVVTSKESQITTVQAELKALVTDEELDFTTFGVNDESLVAGVYNSINYLTIAAGKTLTLDGNGMDGSWVFNIANNLSFGIDSKVVLLNVTDNSSILWNVLGETTAGLTSLGAGAEVRGHILSRGAIDGGAISLVAGIGDSCGGVFSASSTITFAASSIIGHQGCGPIDVPEPTTIWLLGLGLLIIAKRKQV
ncbi:ice-binding family protein [Colwellia hornerae]|nr:ice-binding family protein [Colwellia hornerae]